MTRLKRYEIYQETATLISSVPTGATYHSIFTNTPSAPSIVRVTFSGCTFGGSNNRLRVMKAGTQIETMSPTANGLQWGSTSLVAGATYNIVVDRGISGGTILVEQYQRSREVLVQKVTKSKYVYGSSLMPDSLGMDRGVAGELKGPLTYAMFIPKRWSNCGLAESNWIKDGSANYYRVEGMNAMPGGHTEVKLVKEG